MGEFSFEAHPRTTDESTVALVARHGVNRISMGLQSLDDDVLRRITRRNRPVDEIARIVDAAARAGIVMNVDLLFGLPDQSAASFQRDLAAVAALSPDVITLYRYQPVERLAGEPPEGMKLSQLLDPDLVATLDRHGFAPPRTWTDRHDSAARLLRDVPLGARVFARRERRRYRDTMLRGERRRFRGEHKTYGFFDSTGCNLLGVGPGAYSHIYGFGWFRDVTAVENLEHREPVLWGSRLDLEDECRHELLARLARGIPVDHREIRRLTGIDPLQRFASELSASATSLEHSKAGFRFRDGIDDAERGALLDALLPAMDESRPRVALPLLGDADLAQPELLALRETDIDVAAGAAPAPLAEWCEALGVPGRGRRFAGAWVKNVDDHSVSFAVGDKAAPLLRIMVDHPGRAASFFDSGRFAISYATRKQPLSDAEVAFLEELAARMRA